MQTDSLYIQVQPEMIKTVRKEMAEGSDIYAIYARYRNMSVAEEAAGGDIEALTRCQFVCDLAKHMITEKAMQEQGYVKDGQDGLWKKEQENV